VRDDRDRKLRLRLVFAVVALSAALGAGTVIVMAAPTTAALTGGPAGDPGSASRLGPVHGAVGPFQQMAAALPVQR